MTEIFDSHVHSEFSHDSTAKMNDIALRAKRLNLAGVTVTDHCDVYKIGGIDELENIKKSVESTKKDYPVKVFGGMELGDGFVNPSLAGEAAKSEDFDFILCSCHAYATMRTVTDEFKSGDFRFFGYADKSIIEEFLKKYYGNLIFCAETLDYDALAHITFPFRYINGIAERYEFTADDYVAETDALLEIAVSRQKAVEINTSGVETRWGSIMPTAEILKKYYEMGGRLITLGSDAHTPEKLSCGIPQTLGLLKSIGFREYFRYEKRNPVPVSL